MNGDWSSELLVGHVYLHPHRLKRGWEVVRKKPWLGLGWRSGVGVLDALGERGEGISLSLYSPREILIV